MNKANKHIQTGATTAIAGGGTTTKNVTNSIMNFLPDNRPITSLQIVEDYEKCPENFTPINRTYDQDTDADMWRESILFGRPTTRYLCLSKSEGLPDYVVETLKVIAEKIQAPKFSLLSRTADTDQKAWRKRQIAYKLSKRGTVTQAVTDIILCSKFKIAPDGFKLAGDINGILVCYKTGAIPVRLSPSVPFGEGATSSGSECSEVEKALNRLNVATNGGSNLNRKSGPWNPNQPLPPVPKHGHDDYEEIQMARQISSPVRPAPLPPTALAHTATNTSGHSVGTLGAYSDLEGVPFIINPILKQAIQFTLPTLPESSVKELDYDFQLERQILCTIASSKAQASKNPFFK